MIVYVITDSWENYRKKPGWLDHMHNLEELSGDACLIVHYSKFTSKLLNETMPWAVVLSGASASYDDYDVMRNAAFRRAVKEYPAAQIGICGGHQVIGTYYGSAVQRMRPLNDDEPDIGEYMPGSFKEWGVYPVTILQRDPLFKGLGKTIRVLEHHAWEIRELGKDLVLLASSPACRVQAFVHVNKPVYGVQFHPERNLDMYPDGFVLLTNFFAIARRHWKTVR